MTTKQANILLASVSMGWGTSYIFMKLCVDTVSPLMIIALRFGIAFVVMMLIFYKKVMKVNQLVVKLSAILGVLLGGIFIALLYGMKETSASAAGFLTSTTVILVPLLQGITTRKWPSRKVIFGVTVVTIGLGFLTIGKNFAISTGSLLCLVTAFLYAIHIILTNRFVRKVDTLQLGIFQLGFVSFFAIIGALFFETPTWPDAAISWIAILGLAIICSAYGFVIQPIAQKYTSPEMTGFLFSLEPIFAGLFAFLFLKENIGLQGYMGAVLIISGVLMASWTSTKQANLKVGKGRMFKGV
jgi:drug/metabolite transporter (DMT)-like permease